MTSGLYMESSTFDVVNTTECWDAVDLMSVSTNFEPELTALHLIKKTQSRNRGHFQTIINEPEPVKAREQHKVYVRLQRPNSDISMRI